MEDRQLMLNFAGGLGLLVAFIVVMFIIARLFIYDHATSDPRVQTAIEERIKPVGQVNTGAARAAVASLATQTVVSTAAPQTPKEIYESVCASCHATGVLEAPIYGDKLAWAEHLAEPIDHVYQAAINGEDNMPPRGGRPDLTDGQVRATVDYMLDAVR